MAKRCYYEVLGVERSASVKDINGVYRKLAAKHHPDRNGGDPEATERFKEIAEAYEVLSDEQKRARYDRFGHAGLEAGAGGFGNAGQFGDLFGDIVNEFFGGGGARRGQSIRADVTLSLEEAHAGCHKVVEFHRSQRCDTCRGSGAKPGSQPQVCRRCNGRGQVTQNLGFVRVKTTCNACGGSGSVIVDACGDCHGHGYVQQRVKMEVAIPAGVDTGMKVRLTGEGEPSPEGGPPGDCYVVITVREHKIFRREGIHLIVELPITYTQAALGAKVEVPTLTGPDELDIPRGTQSASVFRLRGRGLPDPRGGARGDLLVRTVIEVPQTLSVEQETLLRQLAELEHSDVTPARKSFFESIGEYFSFLANGGDKKTEKKQS